MHHIHSVQPPPQQHRRLIRNSDQCNDASLMSLIFLWHFLTYNKEGLTTHPHPQWVCCYTLNCSVTVCTRGTKEVLGLSPTPSSCPIPLCPQKIILWGPRNSPRFCCLSPWLPGPTPCYMLAAQARSPCQDLWHSMDAGWRTWAWHRHCSDAQANQENC